MLNPPQSTVNSLWTTSSVSAQYRVLRVCEKEMQGREGTNTMHGVRKRESVEVGGLEQGRWALLFVLVVVNGLDSLNDGAAQAALAEP